MKTEKTNTERTPLLYQNRKNENFSIPVTFYISTGNPGGKLRPEDKDSTRLQELSLMNNTYFGAIRNNVHLVTKLYFPISHNFPKMSLAELGKLQHLFELART